jgi:phage gp36-like protein
MPYITQSDLLQRMTLKQLTQLTDDTGQAQQPDATVVDGVLEEASGMVDGYCRNKYATPLQQSDEVASIARDLAVYLLFSRRPQAMPETIRQRYTDRISLLKDISSGKAVLDQPSGATPQTITAGPVLPQRNELRFKERNLEGFV